MTHSFFWHPCLIILSSLLLTSCTKSILEERGPYLRAYHAGDLHEAEIKLTSLIQKELPQTKYHLSQNMGWIILDRATTRFAQGDIENAIEDYSVALESMDFNNKDLLVEQVAQILIQDEVGAYQASDYEQILARVYMALALIHHGDENNGFAMLRQAEEFQQEKQNVYASLPFTRHYRMPQNGLSKYLFALLLEKRGDYSNAKILYNQAAQLIPCSCEVPFKTADSTKQATILVLCHNGNVPYKISETCPASQASALALELILSKYGIPPACSTLTGVPVPALLKWPGSSPKPTFATLCGSSIPLLPFYNVRKAAEYEVDHMRPLVAARGVSRLLIRRAAVGYLERQDQCLGAIADLAMLIANSCTRVDTRSWTTLPAFIDAARFDVDAGCHSLSIQVIEGKESVDKCFDLQLKPSDLCIIHVFNIHPGVRRILIPSRYLVNLGVSYE